MRNWQRLAQFILELQVYLKAFGVLDTRQLLTKIHSRHRRGYQPVSKSVQPSALNKFQYRMFAVLLVCFAHVSQSTNGPVIFPLFTGEHVSALGIKVLWLPLWVLLLFALLTFSQLVLFCWQELFCSTFILPG
jgi:hypothetical protein